MGRLLLHSQLLLRRWKKVKTPSSIARSKTENEASQLAFPTDVAKRYSGKLLLREEIFLNDTLFHKLLSSQYFTAYPSIKKSFFSRICGRCNNRDYNLFA